MATFEEILNSLLEGLEKDPQADVNELAEQKAVEMGLRCDSVSLPGPLSYSLFQVLMGRACGRPIRSWICSIRCRPF